MRLSNTLQLIKTLGERFQRIRAYSSSSRFTMKTVGKRTKSTTKINYYYSHKSI